MGLSYHFTLHAPAATSVEVLTDALRQVEKEARRMGFDPTMVIDATFETPEGREFARRLTTGLRIQHEHLISSKPLRSDSIWGHDASTGTCRIIPERAVVLVVTDENDSEYCFGFFRYPKDISVDEKRISIGNEDSRAWVQHDFVDSPDARFRAIISMLREAGFVSAEKDEFTTE